ncbi:hypothetical protein Tco_0840704 [Tanacetum coccineum]|uniref:Uncharacterized protein n=1 Tax=Tanacetum coccineum TaxID=301880 RepID=A0ABQ5AWS6_9ASTR
MAEPNDYITATRKNFVTNDNEGRMVEKCIVEIQGAFLVKIRDYAFNGNDWGKMRSEHIVNFSNILAYVNGYNKECIGSITTWDNMVEKFILKFHHLSDHDEEEETKEDDNPNETDNVPEIFKIEGNLFDFETPLFKMMKYSFDDDEEYITIKESEYLNHSKDSLDAYRELLRLIDEG